ncbi:MAG: S1 RNA-binding domain-containing protein [Clostridia bacterium]|nr:S1 RNA-binding domain-containing protein [Oscillospiraceae bacterium]MBQ7032995.1 S1 RNA-binding domain-containing protein [Clostridia bacterium]
MSLEVGKIIEGRVEGITKFGAFVNIGKGQTGLVHISEVATSFVENIHDFLEEGQKVRVKVMSLDKGGKIALSIKKAILQEQSSQPKVTRPIDYDWSRKRDNIGDSFEDKLLHFKQQSDERMQSMKHGNEPRRSASRRGGNR